MNRSIRFVVVIVVLLVIAGGVFVVLLRELDRAGPSSNDVPVLMNPIRDVRVGEWVEWRREDGKIERQEVAAVWNYTYAVKTSGLHPDGKWQEYGTGQPRSTWDLGLGQNFRLISMQPEKITVAGREWNSWRVEATSTIAGRIVSWVTDEIPLGLLRRQMIPADTGRPMLPDPNGRTPLRPVVDRNVKYSYEYLRHGFTDPAEGSGTDGD